MTTAETSLAITSLGNPRNPKTWSGTPNNILQALENQGIAIHSIDPNPSKYQKLPYWLFGKVSGWGRYYLLGKKPRSLINKRVEQSLQGSDCSKILHIGGTITVPLSKLNQPIEQYLFCDSTWNLWSNWATDTQQISPRNLEKIAMLEREAYKHIKHFFPISEYVRENLINHYGIEPQRITVVGTGRGKIEPFVGAKNYNNNRILFVAQNRFEDKGGALLLEGFKIAQTKNSSLQLVIVGQDKYRDLIGSVPNVTVTGFIPWEELQKLFNTGALFAMPAFNEPWGLVYLEALACKTPILGLNRNSMPEITQNGKYGFLVNEPTPESIAEAILQAFADPNKLEEMGAAGQKYCLETFSWEQVANKIKNVIWPSLI